MSLLLITDNNPVITTSAEMINKNAIRRWAIFGMPGCTRNISEIKAAAMETSLIKYLNPNIDLLKLCFAAYTAKEPKSKAKNSQTGIVISLNQSASVKNLRTYKTIIQITQKAANSPLATRNLLSSEMSATGISQNSVSFLEVALWNACDLGYRPTHQDQEHYCGNK